LTGGYAARPFEHGDGNAVGRLAPEISRDQKIDLQADLEKLQRIFWFKTIKRAWQAVLGYTDKSRQALQSMTIVEDFAPLERYIILNENTAKKALAEQKKSVEFLQEIGQ
jgi:hypothetical protein